MATALAARRFTGREFERMSAMAIFGDDERVELLDGVVVPMAPIGDRHVGCVNYLTDCLGDHLRGRALIQSQSAIWLAADWVPQPDVAVLRRGTRPSRPTLAARPFEFPAFRTSR